MKLFDPVPGRTPGPPAARDTILRWELRRLPFNLLTGCAGLGSIIGGVLTAAFTGSACGIPGSPLIALRRIVLNGVVANLMYAGVGP